MLENTKKNVLLFYAKKFTTIGKINQEEEKCIAHSHLINAAWELCYFKFTTPGRLFKMLLDEYKPPLEIYKPIDEAS
jgi:hypothetical protein